MTTSKVDQLKFLADNNPQGVKKVFAQLGYKTGHLHTAGDIFTELDQYYTANGGDMTPFRVVKYNNAAANYTGGVFSQKGHNLMQQGKTSDPNATTTETTGGSNIYDVFTSLFGAVSSIFSPPVQPLPPVYMPKDYTVLYVVVGAIFIIAASVTAIFILRKK